MLWTTLRAVAALLAATGVLGLAGPTLIAGHDPALGRAAATLGELSLRQQVGQLFMVGTPAGQGHRAVLRQIRRQHVGNVMLTGRSHAGVRPTAREVRQLQRATGRQATGGVGLLVATDQEGGNVQVLQGPGFSSVPTALQQGSRPPHELRRAAARWGRQLHRAGVNLDLAPVADTVPGRVAARHNPPIGVFEREYGYRPGRVSRHVVAFARGLTSSGVLPTAKHFPGLGRVHANTDTSSGVTDTETGPHAASLRPFRAAVRAGVPFMMMSTASYSRLDPHTPAAFSRRIVDGLLRGRLGFTGVVVSDDVANALQVARWSPGQRAVKFLRAGGDLVLAVDARTLPRMYDAVLHRARSHPAFRERVEQSALRVLRAKDLVGLLPR